MGTAYFDDTNVRVENYAGAEKTVWLPARFDEPIVGYVYPADVCTQCAEAVALADSHPCDACGGEGWKQTSNVPISIGEIFTDFNEGDQKEYYYVACCFACAAKRDDAPFAPINKKFIAGKPYMTPRCDCCDQPMDY